jgi:hypothetical protein
MRLLLGSLLACFISFELARSSLPIFDAHLHYSHDAWESRAGAGRDRDHAQGRASSAR